MGSFEDAINHSWPETPPSGNIGSEGQGFGIISSGVLGEEQPSFAERISETGEMSENIEDRRGEKVPPKWGGDIFPLPAEVWLNEIQKGLGTNWTPPTQKIGRLPARSSLPGELPKDIGLYDILRK